MLEVDLRRGANYVGALRTINVFLSNPPPIDTAAYDCAWGEYLDALDIVYPENNESVGEAQDILIGG